MVRLFVYDTLMFPRIAQVAIGRAFSGVPAELHGYSRRVVKGELYPGATPMADRFVTGIVWPEVDDVSLMRIDKFEGPLYKREMVSVTRAGEQSGKAFVYVVRPQYVKKLSDVIWDPQDFEKNLLDRFLASYGGFRYA